MDDITIKRSDLIEKVRANREVHALTVEQAEANYLKARFEETKEWALLLKAGEAPPSCSKIAKPESHLDGYDELIAQLEWETRDEIELSAYDFARYVLDKWEWRERFVGQIASSAAYLAGRGS